MNTENTNWYQSVAAVCIKDGKVMLARHTYGSGKGKLIIPGGYAEIGESPQDAVKREFMEEVGIGRQRGFELGFDGQIAASASLNLLAIRAYYLRALPRSYHDLLRQNSLTQTIDILSDFQCGRSSLTGVRQ